MGFPSHLVYLKMHFIRHLCVFSFYYNRCSTRAQVIIYNETSCQSGKYIESALKIGMFSAVCTTSVASWSASVMLSFVNHCLIDWNCPVETMTSCPWLTAHSQLLASILSSSAEGISSTPHKSKNWGLPCFQPWTKQTTTAHNQAHTCATLHTFFSLAASSLTAPTAGQQDSGNKSLKPSTLSLQQRHY